MASSILMKTTRAPTTYSTKNLSSTVVCGKCSLLQIAADRHLVVNPNRSGLCTVNESPQWRIPDTKKTTSARSALVAFTIWALWGAQCLLVLRRRMIAESQNERQISTSSCTLTVSDCEIANVTCIVFASPSV